MLINGKFVFFHFLFYVILMYIVVVHVLCRTLSFGGNFSSHFFGLVFFLHK